MDEARERLPKDVMLAYHAVLTDPFVGVEPLGLGAFQAVVPMLGEPTFSALAAPPGEGDEGARRRALLDRWVQHAARGTAVRFPETPAQWLDTTEGARVKRTPGAFQDDLLAATGRPFYSAQLGRSGGTPRPWLAWITRHLAGDDVTADGLFLKASNVAFLPADEVTWRRCTAPPACSSTKAALHPLHPRPGGLPAHEELHRLRSPLARAAVQRRPAGRVPRARWLLPSAP